jgi:Sugar (and other) transporter.
VAGLSAGQGLHSRHPFPSGAQYDVATELAAIQKEIDAASEKKATFSDLFSSRANLRGLIVSLGLMIFQQFSGVNTVIFYSNDIFKSAGSTLDPSISAIIVGVVQCIVTGLSVVLVDKAGRRLLLLLSVIIMGLCLGVLGFYFFLKVRFHGVGPCTRETRVPGGIKKMIFFRVRKGNS